MDKKFTAHLLKNIPSKPGVYKMKDGEGKIIYIGKAKNLNKRVKSYFQKTDKDQKTERLVAQIEDIDYSIVNNELEAIMLETNLIKRFRPKYNILMKDDKNFVYIKITVNEDFPRIMITRKVEKDGAKYIGPKTAQHKVIKTLKILKKIFPYRHCNLGIEYLNKDENGKDKVKITNKTIKYPCIDFHINRCVGPCAGTISPEEYRSLINKIIDFFEGRYEEILNSLKEEMTKAATEKKFEKAATIRDRLKTIEDIMEKQDITTPDLKDIDVINYYKPDNRIYFNLFQVRGGKLINQDNFELRSSLDTENAIDKTALSAFIKQYYEKATDIPNEVLIPHESEDLNVLTELVSTFKGKKVSITVPQKGHKNKLLDLCFNNAKSYAKQCEIKWQGHSKTERESSLEQLASIIGTDNPPKRIECYDISHIGGTDTASSMVVFENGFPKKSDYRKFRLSQNTPGSPDDYASIKETLYRRLKYLKPSLETAQIKILKSKLKSKKNTQKATPKVKAQSQQPAQIAEAEKEYIEKNYDINLSNITEGKAKILMYNNKKVLISRLDFNTEGTPTRLLNPVIKKIAEKCKTKRIYLAVKQKNKEQFESAGCEIVNKIPECFNYSEQTGTVLVLDLKKGQIDQSFKKTPDLIIIDGGKGQLNIAKQALNEFNIKIPLISIAKKFEEIFTTTSTKPIILSKDSPTLRLVQHIRDESHRFAVSYQTGLHLKSSKQSVLDEIPGIGESSKQKLLKYFGSPENIKNATLFDLEKVIGKKNAIKIKEYFLKK